MNSVLQDLGYGLRLLVRHKGFATAVMATLACCIGANTALFTALSSIALRPLRFPESGRIVSLYNHYPNLIEANRGLNSVPDYFDRRERREVFSSLAIFRPLHLSVGATGAPVHVIGYHATASFFEVLGLQPGLGEFFRGDPGDDPAWVRQVVLTDAVWRRLFRADRELIGAPIRINGEPHLVTGILPPDFQWPEADPPEIVLPLPLLPGSRTPDNLHNNAFRMLGRLASGVTPSQAEAVVAEINRTNLERLPEFREVISQSGFHTQVCLWKEDLVREVAPSLWMLQIFVGVVFLIGCLNAANLYLSLCLTRLPEIGLRSALGASRTRLGRQFLTEALALSLPSGVLGIILGDWAIFFLRQLGLSDLPRGTNVHTSWEAVALGLLLAVGAAGIMSLAPATHLLRARQANPVRDIIRTQSAPPRARVSLQILVTLQTGLAATLVAGAMLLGVSLYHVLRTSPGFNASRLESAGFTLPATRYPSPEERRAFLSGLATRVRAIPGVESATVVDNLPFGSSHTNSVVSIRGHAGHDHRPPVPAFLTVDSGFFAALGIPVLAGRTFASEDFQPGARATVVVDRTFAERFLGPAPAIGREVRQGVPDPAEDPSEVIWYTVIGVVDSIRRQDLTGGLGNGTLFFHHATFPEIVRSWYLAYRTSGSTPGIADAVRDEVFRLDPDLPLYQVSSMRQRILDSLLPRRAPTFLLMGLATLALALAAVGVYASVNYNLESRQREIGVRLALGATPGWLLRCLFWIGMRPVLYGLVLGMLALAAATPLVRDLLFEVSPVDPLFPLGTVGILLLAATTACALPIRRFMALSPMEVLRENG